MWLTHDDRHLRGNVAFVLGRLGDPRGFETIAAILADRSPRSVGQGIPGGNWTVQAQIRADRYYAAHLLGDPVQQFDALVAAERTADRKIDTAEAVKRASAKNPDLARARNVAMSLPIVNGVALAAR